MTVFNGVTPSSQSQQTQRTVKYRTLEYVYGTGYKAILPDGANASIDTWTITWDNIGPAQSTLLENWLIASPPWVTWNGDGAILPATNVYRVTEDGYQKQPMDAGVNAFTVNVEQVF
jgi:hypothetical protein